MNRFYFHLITISIGFVSWIPLVFSAEEGTYEWYREMNDQVCLLPNAPWAAGIRNGLMSIDQIFYPAIEDVNANQKYRQFIQDIKGDTDLLDAKIGLESTQMTLWNEIDKSSALYAERMDAIYDCAAYNTMLRSQNDLLRNVFSSVPLSADFSESLKKNIKALRVRMNERKCRDVSEVTPKGDISLKKLLLDQSTIEYCNYRHYLYYIDFNVKHRLSDLINAAKNAFDKGNISLSKKTGYSSTTNVLADQLADISARAEWAIENAQSSYGLAFEAFREFEREYPSHVFSLAIIAKLTEIRSSLDKTANPISQLIEAAVNAQSPG